MKLIFYFHDGNIEEFSLPKKSLIIGRGKSCDIVLPYDGFSRQHAQIDLIDGDIFITDLGSTNGVIIDTERIPANQKTKMQSFFNLQIGPATRIEIIDDVPEQNSNQLIDSISNSSFGQSGQSFKNPDHISAKTRDMSSNAKPQSTKKIPPEKPKAINPNIIIGVCIIIFAIGYLQFKSENNEGTPTEAASASVSSEKKAPLTDVSFLPKENLESLFFQKSCDGDLAKWCQAAGVLSSSSEGVLIQGKSLIVYYNLMFFKDEKFHPQFDSLPEAKKMEVLLLRRIFSLTLVRTFQGQTQFDNFQAVGAFMADQQYSPVIALKMKRDVELTNLDKFALMGIFDQIINQGAIEELSKISGVYELLLLK